MKVCLGALCKFWRCWLHKTENATSIGEDKALAISFLRQNNLSRPFLDKLKVVALFGFDEIDTVRLVVLKLNYDLIDTSRLDTHELAYGAHRF